MELGHWFRPPRHFVVLFLGIGLALACGLGWLSWRLLEQDRALESQNLQERLERSADLVVASVLRNLSTAEERLGGPDTTNLPEDVLLVVFSARGVEPSPRGRLLYYPVTPKSSEPPASVFAAGETLEFQQKNYAAAAGAFRTLARSGDDGVRAGALLRLARNLRKAGQPAAALAVYREMARLGSTPTGGLPAELLARHESCTLLDESKRSVELQTEARALDAGLRSGRWQLDRAAYTFYGQEVQRWLGAQSDSDSELKVLALAAGVESLWEQWQTRRGETPQRGRRSLWLHDRPVLVSWRATPERLAALVAGADYIQRAAQNRQGVLVALRDAEGHPVMGAAVAASGRQAVRTAADTQLPWTLQVSSADPAAELARLGDRRRLLFIGLILATALVLVGSYVIARAVNRELEVARLQSDFVSAVSHEFRTPLSSLRQISELLADGRVPSEQRRQEYYQGLQRESERLNRLVEDLLDFRRMEAGAQEYHLDPLPAADVVRNVAQEFGEQARARGYEVEVRLPDSLPGLRADREALSRALWNLLDNAVKYSPNCKTVWIEAECENSGVAIHVRDQGLGITPADQGRIFQKFVRAASAAAAGAKGTGLGLAMVQHIVTAHGGKVRVESQPGYGSTFTILLPAAKE